jgi:hypothetical protein
MERVGEQCISFCFIINIRANVDLPEIVKPTGMYAFKIDVLFVYKKCCRVYKEKKTTYTSRRFRLSYIIN